MKEVINKDDRAKVLRELQTLRNHVENVELVLDDVEDDALQQMLTIVWTDIESIIEYVI